MTKISANGPEPKSAAINKSRKKPVTRLAMVATPTTIAAGKARLA
jgi:hypothetical protein